MSPGRSDPASLVSVIVPVYNAGAHLAPCVRSILEQTHSRIEVILVDDGSDDGSGAVCDAFAAEDPRVVVIHQRNGGIAVAQNAGLDVATGGLITFCDNDDLMAPKMIERLVDILDSSGSDMSCCRWSNVGASRGREELEKHSDDAFGEVVVFDDPAVAYQNVFTLTFRRIFRQELRYLSEANWGKLYRAELFDGIRFPAGRYAQDVAVAMRLYERMGSVASCDDAMYFWLQRGDSVSHGLRSVSYYSDIVAAHIESFDVARRLGIVPARAVGGMRTIRLERRATKTREDRARYDADRAAVQRRMRSLPRGVRLRCEALYLIRLLETQVYRLTVHRRR